MKKTRRTLSAFERLSATEFHGAIRGRLCAACGYPSGPMMGPLEAHHVVAAQELRRRHIPVYDVRNALPLHRLCHAQHEAAAVRVPFSALTEQNLEFAKEVLGDYADDYLDRCYPGRVRHGDDE